MNFEPAGGIRLFITGGTIDCHEIDSATEEYKYTETYVPQMLRQARITENIQCEVLMLKDSLFMTEDDRALIAKKCLECAEKSIVITHGTDTMVTTARAIGPALSKAGKTVFLLGSIVPFNRPGSDALFNLGSAITLAHVLSGGGVYITMNGKIFSWKDVRKNKELQVFEKLP